MDKVSIGRIVHFVLPNGEHRPAMVVRVCPDEFPNNPDEKTGLNLQVFLDGTNDNESYKGMALPCPIDMLHGTMWYTSAQYAEPAREMTEDTPATVSPAPGTWHWPERSD